MVYLRKSISLSVIRSATWRASFTIIIIYVELLNPVYKLSEGVLTGVAVAFQWIFLFQYIVSNSNHIIISPYTSQNNISLDNEHP